MKYCADCKWVRPKSIFDTFPSSRWQFAKCANPALQPERKVSSEEMVHPSLNPHKSALQYAADMRISCDKCGPDAKCWEPR